MQKRKLTILAALACLAVIVLGVATIRREIIIRYHLGLLRSDPAYLRRIVDQPEGTPERAAIQEHLESEGGKHDLIRAIRGWFPGWLFEDDGEETHVAVYLEGGTETIHVELPDAGTIAEISYPGSPWLALIQEHLVGSKEWTVPEYPNVLFTFCTYSPETPTPARSEVKSSYRITRNHNIL